MWHSVAMSMTYPKVLFNQGRMRRDFTYIDDVIEAVERVIAKVPAKAKSLLGGKLDPATSTMRDVGFRPATSIEDGVQKFVSWYRQYHRR